LRVHTTANAAIAAVPHPIPIPTLDPVLRSDVEVAFEVVFVVASDELDKGLVGVDVASVRADIASKVDDTAERI
jgi:hypothetical protein